MRTQVAKFMSMLLTSTVGVGVASPAFAEDCETDVTCESHEVCLVDRQYNCPENLDTSCLEGESDLECIDRVTDLKEETCDSVEVGRCVPRWSFPCSIDSECGVEGLVCENSGCTPESETCESTNDCPELWHCPSHEPSVSGICIPIPSEVPVVDPDNGRPIEGEKTGTAGGTAGEGDSDGDEPSPGESGDDEDSSGGCSLQPAAPKSFSPGSLLLAIGAGLIFFRRRRYS